MSWGALGWAAKQRPGKIADKLVLIALADRHNEEEDIAWPSVAWLCEFTGADRKTIIASLDRLEALGLIADTGKRFGKTKQVKGYSLAINGAEKGIPKTEPLEAKSTAFPAKEYQKRDTEPVIEPNVVKAKASTTIRAKPFPKPDGVEQNIWNDFLDLRKAKRAPLSNTALEAIEREAASVGWTLNQAITEMVARGWQGFKANWVKEKQNDRPNTNMGATERAARQALHEISGGFGRFDGGGTEVASGHIAGDNRTIDALPRPHRAIGYAGG